MANVLLNKDSEPSDFHCSCCNEGALDDAFLFQLLVLLANTSLSELTVNSGYRCSKHNTEVGGTKSSLHLVGRACDFSAKTIQAKTVILDAAYTAGLQGIGLGANFIHLDNREIPARWTYPKKS